MKNIFAIDLLHRTYNLRQFNFDRILEFRSISGVICILRFITKRNILLLPRVLQRNSKAARVYHHGEFYD